MSNEKIPDAVPFKIRISAIDRFRGLTIFYMIFGHAILFWPLPQEGFYAGFVRLIWESTVCGAAAFVFLSGMSMSLSYNSYARKVRANLTNLEREKWNGRLQIWIRTAWVAGLAIFSNIIGEISIGEFQIWIWYVLQTVWVARAISYPFLQLRTWHRLTAGFLIIILADPIRTWCFAESPFLYALFFNGVGLNPFFPFVGFFFVGSALGNWLDQWSQMQIRVKKNTVNASPVSLGALKFFTPKVILMLGLLIAFIGISLGWQLVSSPMNQEIFDRLNLLPGWNLQQLPAFLSHTFSAWGLYTLGFDFIILALFLKADVSKLKDLPENLNSPSRSSGPREQVGGSAKKSYKNSSKALTLFGQQSLTVYLTHYFVFFIFRGQLWFWQWLIITPIIVAVYHTLIWVWANGKGKGYTLDWAIGTTTEMAVKAILKRKFPEPEPLIQTAK